MMLSGTTSSSNVNVNVNVFTAAQWEELEQQALIYKYMVSGVPVPTDLILSVRRSLYNSTFSSSSSSFSNHQHNLGIWEGSYQYNQLYQQFGVGGVSGYGRKIDLEPGRCRRTDGKKWRCAKEAYPDSKYCERHMHRGRNRSRKPVEFTNSSSSSSVSSVSVSISSVSSTTVNVSSSPSISISKSIDTTFPSFPSLQTNLQDYRYLQGMKELGGDFHHQNYSHFNFENLKNQPQNKNKNEETQHCFVMGTDFVKSSSSSEDTNKSSIQTDTKPFHHFFAPPKTAPNPNPNPTPNPNTNPTWVELDHFINPPKSPLSTQDLFQSKPRPYW